MVPPTGVSRTVAVVVRIIVIIATPSDWGQTAWFEREKGKGTAVTHDEAKDSV
jgi:hypothetical protein